MKKYVIFILIGILISGCTPESENNLPQILTPTEAIVISPTEPSSTTTPEVLTCKPSFEKIADNVFQFSWDKQQNALYYTQDNEMLTWKVYPDDSTTIMLQEVYPILNGQVTDWIHFLNFVPMYSTISPSGEKAIYWEEAYTRPTPTPAGGEVALTNYEWLQDIYLLTDEYSSPHLVTRVEGGIVGTYWSEDEESVFLLFDQLQIPGDNFVIRLDLVQDTQEVIIPDVLGKMYNHWIALSPDQEWVAFSFRKEPEQIQLLNLTSNEILQINALPEFSRLFWVQENIWLLTNNTNSGVEFIFYDFYREEVIEHYNFDYQIDFTIGKSGLSPTRDQLAFWGRTPGTNDLSFFILSFCKIDE